jgi:hypothetical protein
MGRLELVEKLSCWPGFSFFCAFKALTDSFLCIGAGGDVEQEYYVLIQGESPSAQASFLGKGCSFTKSDLHQFGNGSSRSGPPRLGISGN